MGAIGIWVEGFIIDVHVRCKVRCRELELESHYIQV
jgi:hypothetical protein